MLFVPKLNKTISTVLRTEPKDMSSCDIKKYKASAYYWLAGTYKISESVCKLHYTTFDPRLLLSCIDTKHWY